VVTVTFSEAVFGAGIGITPFTTQSFTLPPNSYAKYCVSWTPLPSSAMHRCLFVTLQQPGFRDQLSQRNIEIIRPPSGSSPVGLAIPVRLGNPLGYTATLALDWSLVGISGLAPAFTPMLPPSLGPGASSFFTLTLAPAAAGAASVGVAAGGPITYGDSVRLDVTLLLDGAPSGGFSVEIQSPLQVYLPLVARNQ
jgi:hypothetical protein